MSACRDRYLLCSALPRTPGSHGNLSLHALVQDDNISIVCQYWFPKPRILNLIYVLQLKLKRVSDLFAFVCLSCALKFIQLVQSRTYHGILKGQDLRSQDIMVRGSLRFQLLVFVINALYSENGKQDLPIRSSTPQKCNAPYNASDYLCQYNTFFFVL